LKDLLPASGNDIALVSKRKVLPGATIAAAINKVSWLAEGMDVTLSTWLSWITGRRIRVI
jgi:hypothetical protein